MPNIDEKLFYSKLIDGVTTVTDTGSSLVIGTNEPKELFTSRKTKFDGVEYNINICDERLLYSSLFAWRDLRLTTLFQGDHEIIYDNTYGKMELAERINYLNTLKVAIDLLNKNVFYCGELFDVINKMINYNKFSLKKEKKLSEEYFKDRYVPLLFNIDEVDYPLDILDFNKSRNINNPQKMLKKYYKNKGV